jgi:hypothetical protein
VRRRSFLKVLLGFFGGLLMPTRVAMGRLDEITGGTDQFGLYVSGPDGTTIIDGTSNMFKITASGTMSVTAPAGSADESTLTLPGLGEVSVTPAFAGFVGPGVSDDSDRVGPLEIPGPEWLWAAASSGGAVTTRFLGLKQYFYFYSDLTGSTVSIHLVGFNAYTFDVDRGGRFYMLLEGAI